MNEGAFALLDCLGFKGIWREASAERVVAKLSAVELAARRRSASIQNFAQPGFPEVKFTFLSDTVVISVHSPTGATLNDATKGHLVRIAVILSMTIAKEFINGDLPRALRGCITYGQFYSSGNFIVGPAVDESANAERLAEGAFIWLTPEAGRLLDVSTATALHLLHSDPKADLAGQSAMFLRQLGETEAPDLLDRFPTGPRQRDGQVYCQRAPGESEPGGRPFRQDPVSNSYLQPTSRVAAEFGYNSAGRTIR